MKKTFLIGSVLLAFAYPLANFLPPTNADVLNIAQNPPKTTPKSKPLPQVKPKPKTQDNPTINPNENNQKPDVSPISNPQIQPSISLKSRIEVINTGVNPKIPLRLTPKVNQTEKAKLTLNVDTQVLLKNKSVPTPKMPQLLVTLETTVTNVEKNGNIGFKFTISDAQVINDKNTPEKIVKSITENIKQIEGFGGNFVVDNQGNPKSSKFNFPKQTNPMLQQLVEQINSSVQQIAGPLPTESVGVGAKWNVIQNMSSSMITFDQTTTYEIVSLKDGKATLKVGLKQTAPPQNLRLPGLPPRSNFAVKSYTATGEGQVMMTLNQLLPISSDIKMTSNIDGQLTLPVSPNQKKPNQPDKTDLPSNQKKSEQPDKTDLPLTIKLMINAMIKSE